MSDSAQSQRQIVALLVVAAVLAAAIIGFLLWKNFSSGATAPNSAQVQTPAASSGMPPAASQVPDVEFDPATAPVVPAGQTPEQYVTAYYELCGKGDYEKAFTMLPIATQRYYGNSEKFKSTLEGYGLGAFKVSPQKQQGDEITVVGTQEAQGMSFPYTWTFVKRDDGSWVIKSRQMGSAQ